MQNETILNDIIQGMAEGVLIIGSNGRVIYTNPAAAAILAVSPEELSSQKLASVFYGHPENERFFQTVIDALVNPDRRNYDLVPFYTGSEYRQLHVMTSVLHLEDSGRGIIMTISDVTELASLRIRYTQQITALLDSLVKAFSTAVDGRSHYTANHTRNMVKLATAFLDWLDKTDDPMKFDGTRRRAFLMSVWLHDVGKLTIPLEIMDKATRLGTHMDDLQRRLDRIRLLEKITVLEGGMDASVFRERENARQELLANIRRINTAGWLGDGDLEEIGKAAELRYREEDGSERPLLTEEELKCLRIRKGTLTEEERGLMQEHVVMTGKILGNVEFPDGFENVPGWASAHHELINGRGYPAHMRGEALGPEIRLLTILDIFEALTAADRPYKQPIPTAKALQILHSMADEGSLDAPLLELFERSRAWEPQDIVV